MKFVRTLYPWAGYALVAVLLIWSARGSQVQNLSGLDLKDLIHFLRGWWPPSLSAIVPGLKESIVTIQMAIFGTFVALVFAVLSSFGAARNLSPNWGFYTVARGILSFLRSVPVVVFGLIFVPMVGLGPLGGLLALILHNWGVLGKLIAERIEAIDQGPQEAVISTGSTWVPMVAFGVIPQVLPHILSDAFYRFEVNVRDTMVLGFIGAGGIGNDLFVNFKSFDYASASTDVFIIMVLVVFIDIIGAFVRKRVT